MAASLIEYHTYRYIDTCMHAHIYLHIHYLRYTTLHCITLYIYIDTFYYIVLGYATLDYIALPCIAFAFALQTHKHTYKQIFHGTFTEISGQRRPMMGTDQGFLAVPGVFSWLRKTFGTLDRSVVELYMAMTGGTDWVVQYEVPRVFGWVRVCGWPQMLKRSNFFAIGQR